MYVGNTLLSLKHTPVDSRTAELVAIAIEIRQLLALGERRQRACIKRANQVSFEKKEHNRQYVGFDTSTLLFIETREYAPVN